MKFSEEIVKERLSQLWVDLDIKPNAWARSPGDSLIQTGDVTDSDMHVLAELEREIIEALGWKFGDWQNRPGTYIWFGCVRGG